MKQLYIIMSGKIGKKGSSELRIKPVAVRTRKHEASVEKKRLQGLRPNTEYWIETVKA